MTRHTHPTDAAFTTAFSTPPAEDTWGPIFHLFSTLDAKSSGDGSDFDAAFVVRREGPFVALLAASTRALFTGRGLSSGLAGAEVSEDGERAKDGVFGFAVGAELDDAPAEVTAATRELLLRVMVSIED